jgi:hypothetical protein
MPLRMVDVRTTLPVDCIAASAAASLRRLMGSHPVQARRCVFRRDAAQRFAARTALELTQGLVPAYPAGAYVVEAGAQAQVLGLTKSLMVPLNSLTDEWYSVYYELDGP